MKGKEVNRIRMKCSKGPQVGFEPSREDTASKKIGGHTQLSYNAQNKSKW